MAAPTNSGESDMATEDFCLNLSPLLSPGWSQLCLTPSPPRSFLPSSSSMVMHYQGSNQSMDDPPQNQEHDDIVDPAPYLARDSASDWRPRGGGIMTMNNQGFEESNMGIEESMEMTTCFYFPPSPTNFPLYRPMPSVFFVSSEQENISLAFSYQHILEDKSGALRVINGEDVDNIFELLLFDGVTSYVDNKFGAFDQIAVAADQLESLVDYISEEEDFDEREATLRRINWLEQDDVDIVDQPVYELLAVVQQQIQNRGGELDVILGGGILTVNGLEHRDGQGSPTTPETLLIRQAKLSFRLWLAHDGQWVVEIRWRCSRLNNGRFTTVEDAISAYEMVVRWSGWKDLTGFAGLFENENRSNLPLQLPLPAQELNPIEDFGLVCCNGTRNDEIESVGTGSEGTEDCIMADQAWLNSGCLGKRKTKENNPGGERRSKKTNGVRIVIPLEDILQTKGMSLNDAANHLGVSRSAQLNPDTLPSDQALAATIDTNSVVVKEIVAPLFLPIARQENLDEDFGNGVEAVGMGSERTGESETEDGQLNSWYLGKGKRKKMTPRGERRNKKTNGVRMTKEMLLKDPAKHLKGGEREAEPEPEAAEDEAADAAAGNAAHILVAEAIPLEDIPQTKGVCLKDAAMNLNVSQSSLKYACREYGIPRWPPRKLITQSHPTETPALVDQEGIPQSNSDTLPSDQALAATVEKITSVIVKENLPPPFSPTARPERLDEDFGNVEAEAVFSQIPGIELTPRGERRNKETGGVRIAISLEEILQTKEMLLKDAAKHLKVSKSTLKRACRGYDIPRWPPRGEHKLISQSCPNESPAVVDKEPIPQLNSDTLLPSNQISTTIGTKSVIVKARFNSGTLKFQLSWPWRMEELEEQVKKRLGHKAENYYINYKDEDNEYILIGCDEDLQDHISSSILLGTNSIEVFLQPKPK